MTLYRGAGGAVFDITPPALGTPQREQFDAQVEAGALVEVEPRPEAKPQRRTTKREG